MSTLNVGTIKSLGTSVPVFQNSSGVEKGQLAKAWVNFDGTDEISGGLLQIKDSFNVSSITDNGNGDYHVTFTNPMANKNYAAFVTINIQSANTRDAGTTGNSSHTDNDYITTGFRITIEDAGQFGQGRANSNRVCAVVFGD